jgi:hypothetical protein
MVIGTIRFFRLNRAHSRRFLLVRYLKKRRLLPIAVVAIGLVAAAALITSWGAMSYVRTGNWFQSRFGIPQVDGVATPGEWPAWSNLTLVLDDVLGATPSQNQNVAIAVMNTGANLYFAIQVPNSLQANETDVLEPPYHTNTMALWMLDGFDRGWNITWVTMGLKVMGASTVREEPYFVGVMPTPFTSTDPSRPFGAAAFQPGQEPPRGVYTFEMAFPLILLPPALDANGRLIYMGLRPVAVYELLRLSFIQDGHDGNDTFYYSYALPREWSVPASERLYISTALDPLPWIVACTAVAIAFSVAYWEYRRRRRRQQAAKARPATFSDS